MPPAAAWTLSAALVWTGAALALTWGRLSAQWRRAAALATSAIGIAMLMFALSAHGQRETLTTGQFLLGGAYVTGLASASAGLRYYVATAMCLLVGTAGLAWSDEAAAASLRRHWVATAAGVSFVITGLRFALEIVAAPTSWTRPVGIFWLAPAVGAVFYVHLREEGEGWSALTRPLIAYALASRGAVAALMVLASVLRLGSHYDLSGVTHVWVWGHARTFRPGSLAQILYLGTIPQLTFWVVFTVLTGWIGAGLAAALGWWARRARGGLEAPPAAPHEARGAEPST